MLLRIIGFVLLFCCSMMAFASENKLIAIKPMLLPENQLRLDFRFLHPVKKPPTGFMLKKPERLVLDFSQVQTELSPGLETQSINKGSLLGYQLDNANNRVRVLLDLKNPVSWSGSFTGNQYTLILRGKSEPILTTENPAHFKLRKIDFKSLDSGSKNGGRLIVNVSDSNVPVNIKQAGSKLIVNFENTLAVQNVFKDYDFSDLNTPVQKMMLKKTGSSTQLTLWNRDEYSHFSYQVNNQFILDIFPLSQDQMSQSKPSKTTFTGKSISLDFQKIQVNAVLQLLAEVAGINIVVGSAVGQEEIALHLKEVPWDQALDIILTAQNLGKREHGNIIFVDSVQNIAVKVIEDLKNKQEASKQEPLRADLIEVNYAKASEIAVMLKDKDTSLLSARGAVSVDVRTNSLWIQDTNAQIKIIRELIAKLDVPVRQVAIESRIVTVDKDFSQDLGIHWGISKAESLDGTSANNGVPLLPFLDRLNLDLAALPMGANPASVGLALARLGEGILLDLELSALESESRGEVIASPRLITSNQQPATIESGTEIPYQEATSSGATAVSFKKAVLSLSVTPQITPDNKIMMILKINQDRPGVVTNGVPAINTKQIQTNVLVNNGQTIVLGGIYQQDKKNTLSRVPFLGDLPLVGSLFRSKKVSVRNEELLIFITPRIITNAISKTVAERTK